MASSISQDAQQVLSGVDQATQSKILAAGSGDILTSGEAKALLAKYGVDPNAVLSADNINQTANAPVPAPDDLLGIRAQLFQSNGVNEAQTAYESAVKAFQDAQNTLNESNLQLRNRPVSVGKFTGQIGQNTMVNAQNIKNLQDAASLALESLNAKKTEAEAQFAIRESEVSQKRSLQAQYAGAGIKLTDSFDTAISKIDKYQKKVEADTYKKTLKAKALELGIKTSGSTKDLEKRIGSESKSALELAKKRSELEMEQIRTSIANTKSEIANRGTESAGSLQEVGSYIDANGNEVKILRNSKTGQTTTSQKLADEAGINTNPSAAQDTNQSWWSQFSVTDPSTWFNF